MGNPCCEHPDAIQTLKTSRPGLEIITEGEDTSPTTREDEDDGNSEIIEDEKSLPTERQFNVDELLKEIVERKCKIDSLQTMNIPHILHVSIVDDIYRLSNNILCRSWTTIQRKLQLSVNCGSPNEKHVITVVTMARPRLYEKNLTL